MKVRIIKKPWGSFVVQRKVFFWWKTYTLGIGDYSFKTIEEADEWVEQLRRWKIKHTPADVVKEVEI